VDTESLVVAGEDGGIDAEVVGDLLGGLVLELALRPLADGDHDLGVGSLQCLVRGHEPGRGTDDVVHEHVRIRAHALKAFHLLR
jgi:hypothetical protein